MEIWKAIIGFERYQISNLGRVKSLPKTWVSGRGRILSHDGKILFQQKSPQGYLSVKVSDGKHKRFRTHRLVALAFIPNPENKPEVNHKDGNKENNHVSNLEWATGSENVKHSFDAGLKTSSKGENHGRSKLNETAVREIRYAYNNRIATFRSLAKKFQVHPSVISDCAKLKTWNHI